MAVFFLFLRNVLLPIEILKIKILEHSDPPSQHFFVHKAFSHSFLCRRKVVLCHLAEWHKGARNFSGPVFQQNNLSANLIADSEQLANPLQTTTEPQDSLDSGFQWLYNQPMPPAFWARLESMTNLMRYSIYNF